MTEVQNETTVTITSADLLAKVQEAIGAHNKAEARGRKALAHMVATFVEMGERYIYDAAITKALDDKCKEHGLAVVSLTSKTNYFLSLVRMISGEWVTVEKDGKPVKDKDGTPKKKWAPNRSFEKYASVMRFFIHNEISSSKVAEILLGGESIEVGLDNAVEPTITAIVAADSEQHGTKRSTNLWNSDLALAAERLREIASVEMTPVLEKAVQFNEDDYAAVIVRKRDGRLEILGDAAGEVDTLNRMVKRRAEHLEQFLKVNGDLFEVVTANAA